MTAVSLTPVHVCDAQQIPTPELLEEAQLSLPPKSERPRTIQDGHHGAGRIPGYKRVHPIVGVSGLPEKTTLSMLASPIG